METRIVLPKNIVSRRIVSTCVPDRNFRWDLAKMVIKRGGDARAMAHATDADWERALLRVLNGEDFLLEIKE